MTKNKGVVILESNFICVDSRPVGGAANQVVNDVLLAVVARTLEELGAAYAAGTFILDGQRYGEDAQCILRFNLSNNCFGLREFFRQTCHTCTEVAEASIDEILEIEDRSMRIRWGDEPPKGQMSIEDMPDEPVCHFAEYELLQRAQDGLKVMSRIYQNDVWQVLVLNARCGRFLCSVCMNDGEGYDGKTVAKSILHAVATALGHLGRGDSTLSESYCIVNCPTGLGDTAANRQHRRVINLVKAMFETGEDEAIQKWQTWHQEAEKSGQLKLFFQ